MSRCVVLGLLVWLAGCGGSDGSDSECATAQCRQDRVIAAWQTDRQQVQGLLDGLPDTVERVAAVSKLVDLYPAEVGPLCDGLPEGPSKDRCRRASTRSHLHVDKPMALFPSPSSETQPSYFAAFQRRYATQLKRDSPLSAVAASAGACESSPDMSACLLSGALQRALDKDVQGAAALCNAMPLSGNPPGRWRSECFFGAAENRLKVDRAAGYADAIDLCAAAELYSPFCIKHLLDVMSRSAPASDVSDAQGWAQVLRSDQAIQDVWAGAEVMPAMRSGLWAVALSMSVDSAQTVTGDALEFIPQDMVVHLRAAVAARLLADQGVGAQDLDGWVSQVQSALTKRSGRRRGGPSPMEFQAVGELWPRSGAQEAGLSIIPYRGTARRVVVQAPEADIAICVLEAAARMNPVPRALLTSGQKHADPAVQWTAGQLLEWAGTKPRGKQPPGPGIIP